MEVQEIEGYFGHNPKFETSGQLYMTHEQMVRIRKNLRLILYDNKTGRQNFRGYNAIQLKIKPKNSKIIELQIREKK